VHLDLRLSNCRNHRQCGDQLGEQDEENVTEVPSCSMPGLHWLIMARHPGEWREELAASTITGASKTSGAGAPRVPGLTLVAHPDLRRVGERVALPEISSGRPVKLSRLVPLFSPPGGGSPEPLADPHLSRNPLLLLPGPAAGSVLVRRGD